MSQNQKTKGVVDIVFLLDATGSMSPCIDALKKNIQTFVTGLTSTSESHNSPVKDWRAKVVGFRDYEVDIEPYVDHPFVRTPQELQRQLAGLIADGGGDEPESLLDGLYQVANMPATPKGAEPRADSWRHKTSAARVVVVFSDASFKEPLANPKGATFDDVANLVMTNRICLSIFAPEIPCYEKLSEIDKSEWNVVSGGSTPQESLRLYTADQTNFRETMKQLAKTVSATADVPLL